MFKIQGLLHYQIIGEDSSPKLVFLHGIMGQGRNWSSIAKKFARHFQCLIFDQRGHGRSYHPDEGFEISDYSNDLVALLDSLGWSGPISLVGHSMGGRVAVDFAHRFPERLKHLVVVDIGPVSDWQSMAAVLEKLRFVPVPFSDRQEAREFFDGPFLERFNNKMVAEFFYSNLATKDSGFDWLFSKKLIEQTLEQSRWKDRWAEFKALQMKTLLIRGQLSTDLSQEVFDKTLEANPLIQGVVVEGAGHWVHAEKPRETLKIIEDFFGIAGSNQP